VSCTGERKKETNDSREKGEKKKRETRRVSKVKAMDYGVVKDPGIG
jgi:hypothetical protein